MTSVQDQGPPVQAQLGLWDAVSIIVGIVVGVGIYETPPLIFQNVSGPAMALEMFNTSSASAQFTEERTGFPVRDLLIGDGL